MEKVLLSQKYNKTLIFSDVLSLTIVKISTTEMELLDVVKAGQVQVTYKVFFTENKSKLPDVGTDLCHCQHLLDGVEVVSLRGEELRDVEPRSLLQVQPVHPFSSLAEKVSSSQVQQSWQSTQQPCMTWSLRLYYLIIYKKI